MEFEKKYVSCVSSGNAAASLSAQCTVHGTATFLISGIFEEIFELHVEAVKQLDIFESSQGCNRFRVEEDKTIAYEL